MAARIPGTEGQIDYLLTEIESEKKNTILTEMYYIKLHAFEKSLGLNCSLKFAVVYASAFQQFQVLRVKKKWMSFFRLLKNEIVHLFLIPPKLRKDEKRPDIVDDCSANQITAFSSVY